MKKEILNKIKKGEVKMKPRWKFVAEEAGVKALIIGILIMCATGLSMLSLFWELYQPTELIGFGEIGWQLIKEDFPYLWLIVALILGGSGLYLEPKIGNNYRKGWQFWTIVTILVVFGLTILITFLN